MVIFGIMENKLEAIGIIGTIKGLYREYIGDTLGLYWDNGKENGNYYNGESNGKENGNYYNEKSSGKENGK